VLGYNSKALASWIFLSFTSFWRNSDSYEHKYKSARRRAQFVPIGMPTTYWNYIGVYVYVICLCVYEYVSLYFFFYLCNIHSLYFSNKIQKGKTCYSEEQERLRHMT
jgi:hypothetical protein